MHFLSGVYISVSLDPRGGYNTNRCGRTATGSTAQGDGIEGESTQLHRGDPHAEPNDTFVIEGTEFVVTAVETETLGSITEEGARAEGSPNLEAYKHRIEESHGSTWDDESEAVLHEFEPVTEPSRNNAE